MLEALKELRTILVESDISSFEINHSGLIAALLGFMVDEAGYTSAREQRLRSFINTFADCPVRNCVEATKVDRLCIYHCNILMSIVG